MNRTDNQTNGSTDVGVNLLFSIAVFALFLFCALYSSYSGFLAHLGNALLALFCLSNVWIIPHRPKPRLVVQVGCFASGVIVLIVNLVLHRGLL